MKFAKLASFFEQIEKTSSRLTITDLLAQLFNALSPGEIQNAIYLLQGRVAPLYEKIESGMAEKMVIRGVVKALQIEEKTFRHEYQTSGDIGKTVEILKKRHPTLLERQLSVSDVFQNLHELAVAAGEGSQERKIQILADLVQSLDPLSARYVVRIPMGIMRLGFSDMTVLDSLSWMITHDKSLRPFIERVYHVRPDLGFIARQLKEKGQAGLHAVKPKLFTPILMMRAERLSSSEEIIEKIGTCIVEPKYDGFRLQIHFNRSQKLVRLYSRNLEDVTLMYPDLVSGIRSNIRAEELICEGEAIGYDPQSGGFLPFQETVQRKRKYGIDEKAKEVPLRLFLFELLYLNGESYLRMPYEERRKKLDKIVKEGSNLSTGSVVLAPAQTISKAKDLDLFFEDALSQNLEGLVAKKRDGIYQPGARGWNWIKYKRSYSAKIKDTIDCLVMGFDYGKGKRAGFGIGAFLAGVYDGAQDRFVTIAKIGTGLTDEEWRALRKKAGAYKTEQRPPVYDVDKMMACDIWIKPVIVVEIKADEITRSPVHTAGRTSGQSSGFALRFPRLQRFREDKRPEEVTTVVEVRKLFSMQKNNHAS